MLLLHLWHLPFTSCYQIYICFEKLHTMFACFHHLIEHLWSNFYSHFPHWLTVCNEINPSFWHFVAINDVLYCSFHSMRDIFVWKAEFCSDSYSWLALCNILLFFFKQPSLMQVAPSCILQLRDLPPNNKNTTCEFIQSPIFVVYSYFYMSHWSYTFFHKSCSIPKQC